MVRREGRRGDDARPHGILPGMRFFNTEGPIVAKRHYCIPPLERIDLADVLDLIRQERYFVLHAPRQTGKTSALIALRDLPNGGTAGEYRCVYVNVEAAQAVREDVGRAMRVIVGALASWSRSLGDGFLYGTWTDILETFGEGALGEALTRWCEADPRPLVLLIDEIDSLIDDTLISVLRQLRAGYVRRPGSFPQSVVLCGGRIEREYGLGRGRSDLLILWPRGGERAPPGAAVDRHVVERKVLHGGLERTIADGLEQTAAYMDRCGSEAGHLVVFDRREERSWEEKLFRRAESVDGRPVTVWGM